MNDYRWNSKRDLRTTDRAERTCSWRRCRLSVALTGSRVSGSWEPESLHWNNNNCSPPSERSRSRALWRKSSVLAALRFEFYNNNNNNNYYYYYYYYCHAACSKVRIILFLIHQLWYNNCHYCSGRTQSESRFRRDRLTRVVHGCLRYPPSAVSNV